MDDPRIQIIGEAANLDHVELEQMELDVVVWSQAQLLDQEAFLSELTNFKLGENVGLLIICDDPHVIEKLIRLKVQHWGALSLESTQAELITAIEALTEGLVVTNPTWLEHLYADQVVFNGEKNNMVEILTEREIELLQLMALGLTNKQIAGRLGISPHTVKFHVSAIFGKMGTTNRTETVKLGLKTGLILL